MFRRLRRLKLVAHFQGKKVQRFYSMTQNRMSINQSSRNGQIVLKWVSQQIAIRLMDKVLAWKDRNI